MKYVETSARERLEEYVKNDKVYQDYLNGKLKEPSDFEMFCIQHCEDIELALKVIEETKKFLKAVGHWEED